MTTSSAVPASRDAALATRCAAADRGAQRELFQLTRNVVHHTLFRILGSNQDMEDLLQETYLEIYRSIARYAGRSSLVTWCCAIASHVALGHLRARRRPIEQRAPMPELPATEPGAERVLRARQAAERLYVTLDRIDATHRIAFALAVIDGRPLAEVAELTDASVSAVKTRVWRARKELDRLASKDPVLSAYVADLAADQEEPS